VCASHIDIALLSCDFGATSLAKSVCYHETALVFCRFEWQKSVNLDKETADRAQLCFSSMLRRCASQSVSPSLLTRVILLLVVLRRAALVAAAAMKASPSACRTATDGSGVFDIGGIDFSFKTNGRRVGEIEGEW
jgi:hypothetical protein